VIKGISPIAWRHVNLLGKFEFQRPQNPISVDELIKALEQKIMWQMQKPTDRPLKGIATISTYTHAKELAPH